MRVPAAVSIFRRVERGADMVTQLLLFEYREARRAVAHLYTRVPRAVTRLYRRKEVQTAREKAAATFAEEQRLERIIRDPQANETEKTLARMELVILRDPNAAQRAKGAP